MVVLAEYGLKYLFTNMGQILFHSKWEYSKHQRYKFIKKEANLS